MAMRVLVTRPEPGASRTAARLRLAGFEPVVLPLTETQPLQVPPGLALENAAAIAVTSANGLHHAPPSLLEELRNKPCFVVGRRTAEAARKAGFVTVFQGEGDAESLARKIITMQPAGARVLYLCGRLRRTTFEAELQSAGLNVQAIEVYETVRRDRDADFVDALLGKRPVDFVLVFSAAGAEAARALIEREDLAAFFHASRILCISERAAAPLAAIRNPVLVAEQPDEDGIFALLRRPEI